MNCFALSVWYALIISAVLSIPRHRHINHQSHHRYPVTLAMHHCHQPTALQALQTELLHAGRPFLHKHPFGRRMKRRRHQPRRPSNASIPPFLLPFGETFKLKPSEPDLNGCIESFGPKSPLCKTRSEIRRKSRGLKRDISMDETTEDIFQVFKTATNNIFKPPGNVKENSTMDEDFFGLFSTISCTSSTTIYKTEANKTSTAKFSTTSAYSSLGINKNKSDKSGDMILLPGNLANLQDVQTLFLDHDGGMQNDGYYKSEDGSLMAEESVEPLHGWSGENVTSLMATVIQEYSEPSTKVSTEEQTKVSTITTNEPSAESTTVSSTVSPTKPSMEASKESPSKSSTELPTEHSTEPPKALPTEPSVESPTKSSTKSPTEHSSESPTEPPTVLPSETSAESPTKSSTKSPTEHSSEPLTELKTVLPTEISTVSPTKSSTESPAEHSAESPTDLPKILLTEPSVESPTEPSTESPTVSLWDVGTRNESKQRLSREHTVEASIPIQQESELLKNSKPTQGLSTKNSSNEKLRCIAEHGKNCVCSLGSLVQDLHRIFSSAKSTKDTFDQVFLSRCKQYVPAPESFELSSSIKPRVLSANIKPTPLDPDKGPKELPEKSLSDFLDHIESEEDDVSRVFVNTDVQIPCFPTRDVHLSPSEADHVSYSWTHGNKEAITEGRISENPDADGTLAIEDVAVADTDNYTCEVSYTNPDTGQRTEEQYEHSLTVVTLPVVTVRVTVHYHAPVPCDPGTLELMELYLPQQLERTVCQDQGLCTVQLHSPVCYTQPAQERAERSVMTNDSLEEIVDVQRPRQARQTGDSLLMSLNYEVYLHRQGVKALTVGNNTSCDPTCHLVLTFRLIQIFRESMADIMLTPVLSAVSNLSGVFTPLANTIRLRYIFGCVGGYRLDDGFCVACDRGHYSEDGWTECLPCPPRTYMGRPGARRCISCHSRWILYCNEYVQTNNILVIVAVVVGSVLLVTCLVLYYNISKKSRRLAFVMKSMQSKKPHRRAKLGKAQKRHSPSKMELQRLIEESPGEESDTVTVGR